MTSLLFKKEQNDIFQKQIEDNNEEIKSWYVVNVVVPIVIILIPTLLYSFLPCDRVTFQNLILNGSFPLLGINILFTTSIFLINSLRLKDEKVEKQIYFLRLRLIIYLCALLILGTLLYFIQIAFAIDSIARTFTSVIGFVIILYYSIGIGKRIYLIKDELVGKSYSDEVKDTVVDLKKSVDDLF